MKNYPLLIDFGDDSSRVNFLQTDVVFRYRSTQPTKKLLIDFGDNSNPVNFLKTGVAQN